MSIRKLILLFVAAFSMCACVSKKQLTYFIPVTSTSADSVNGFFKELPDPIVKVNDALVITVSAMDPEAVVPYNLPTVNYISPNSSMVPTSSLFQYYTVDPEGNIDFPVLGKLHIEGMTQTELKLFLEDKLRAQIVDPLVIIRFLDAQVTVLGEVAKPGRYTIPHGRMTLLEALGAAGDMTQYGSRTNVLITREKDGKLEFARLNMTSDEIFRSPYFYLQQNDVIYVSPNQARSTSNQTIGLWLSMVSTVASAATVVVSVLSATGSFKK